MKINVSLVWAKPICMIATVIGIFEVVSGSWITGLCLLLGSYLFEKNFYCCPVCKKKLDMKSPLFRGARCPSCGSVLREP